MHRLRKTALCVILAVFCCASSAYGADDLITWIRRTGGLVKTTSTSLQNPPQSFVMLTKGCQCRLMRIILQDVGPLWLQRMPSAIPVGPSEEQKVCIVQVDLEIGAVNDKGLRGTKAARDMKKDQIAVHLPAHLAIPLGDGSVTPEVRPARHCPCPPSTLVPEDPCQRTPSSSTLVCIALMRAHVLM